MRRHRTTAGLLLALLLWAVPATASAEPPKRLIFPVVGPASFVDDFGDPRGQGPHQGNDIIAPWRAPVVAAEAGRVSVDDSSARAGCMLELVGRSKTRYVYIHLNNDLTPENDNEGGCEAGVAYAPGLEDGQKVRAGQLLGYVGDSGDADGIHPHLHFELHPDGGAPASPFQALEDARRVLFAAPEERTDVKLVLAGTVRLVDDHLRIRVERVRLGSGRRHAVARNVALALASGMVVERSADGVRTPATLVDAIAGERVVVWTAGVAPSLRAQVGAPGALSAAKVLLRGPKP